MLKNLSRILTNTFYLVPFTVHRFKKQNPEEQILAASATKARKNPIDAKVQYEAGWITSRRGTLILTADRLVCGSWEIPIATITEATLLQYDKRTTSGFILDIYANNEHYQFGLLYDPVWTQQTVLKLKVKNEKLEYSGFSIILRVGFLIVFVWLILDRII